jgi:hypothetical protein
MINNEINSWTQPVGSEINMETVTKGKQSRVYKSLIMIRLDISRGSQMPLKSGMCHHNYWYS